MLFDVVTGETLGIALLEEAVAYQELKNGLTILEKHLVYWEQTCIS